MPAPHTQLTRPLRSATIVCMAATAVLASVACTRDEPPHTPAPTPTPEATAPRFTTLPRYTAVAADNYITTALLKHDDPARITHLVTAYREIYGEAEALGLLLTLNERAQHPHQAAQVRNILNAARQTLGRNVSPDPHAAIETYDAARALERLLAPHDNTPPLTPDQRDIVDAWAADTLRDIASHQYNVYDPVERHMGNAEDYLAVQCARWLLHRDKPVPPDAVAHLRQREPVSELHSPEIAAVLKQLPDAR